MTRTFHPCCWFGVFFASGILTGYYRPLPLPGLAGFFAGATLVSLFIIRRRYLSLPFLALTIFVFGMFLVQSRTMVSRTDISRLSYETRRDVLLVQGLIDSPVEQRDFFKSKKTMFVMNIENVLLNGQWRKKEGRVMVQIFRPEPLNYGDRIRLEGKLHQPFVQEDDGPVSYKDYLRIRGIRYIFSVKKSAAAQLIDSRGGSPLRAHSYRLAEHIKEMLGRHLTPAEAGLMDAVILGDRSRVPDHVNELFQRTGTVHVLAISGFNVGIVAGLFMMVLRFFPLSRRLVLSIVIVLLAGYCFLSGSSPSVLRATIMIIILLIGFILEKDPQPMNTLAAAGIAILLYNPLYIFDIGFQLSFICVAAIFLITPFLKRDPSLFEEMPEWEIDLARWIYHSLMFSLGIWIAVAGLIAYYFRIITPVTILANLLVVPAIGAVISLGFLLLLVELLLPLAGFWVAMALKVVLNLLIAIVFLFDQIPYASLFIKNVSAWQLIVYYSIVLLASLVLLRIDKPGQV